MKVIDVFRELIDRLKSKKKQLQVSSDSCNKSRELDKPFDINVSKENNFLKIVISDYVSLNAYMHKLKLINEEGIDKLLFFGVLWNCDRQKINKGTYYVVNCDNRSYNVLLNEDGLKVIEMIKKEEITEQKSICLDANNTYHYFSCKHDKYGSSYHLRYYNPDNNNSMGNLDLSREEAYEEINLLITNLESIDGILNIIDIDLLKKYVLADLCIDSTKKKIL